MSNGGAEVGFGLSPPLNMGDIAPFRVYTTHKECLGFPPTFEGEGVSIRGHCHRVDLDEKKLPIEWQVSCASPPEKWSASPPWEGAKAASRKPLYYTTGVYAVDVYLIDDTGNTFTYEPTKSLGLDKFETVHKMQALGRFLKPLDSYSVQLFAFGINPVNNLSVDIAQFPAPTAPTGFTVSSHYADVMDKFTYDTGNGSEITRVKSRALTLTIRYSAFALALTTCMFATNWALTLASLCITFSTMKKGRITWSAFALHSTMALVVPSIRRLYLCPLPFDTTGSFSQGVILSFCSLALLRALVVQPRADKKTSSQVESKM